MALAVGPKPLWVSGAVVLIFLWFLLQTSVSSRGLRNPSPHGFANLSAELLQDDPGEAGPRSRHTLHCNRLGGCQ